MGDNSSSERTLEYMVRKRQKTIGNYIMFILLAVGLIPLIAMALAIYDTTSDLLMARNDSAKLSAVNVVQTERSKLQKQSEYVLRLRGILKFPGENMMKKSSSHSLIVPRMLVSTSRP